MSIAPDAKRLIFLLTPQHTGTHFARLLLECHSQIAFCITESRRIDRQLRPEYRLHANGNGPDGPPHEVMLDEYVTGHFRGAPAAADFVELVRYCMTRRSERFPNHTVYEHVGRATAADLRGLGIRLEPKRPRYLLFHGHCGPKYEGADFAASEFPIVVTLRHPLLSVISALRRTQDPGVAHDLLVAYDKVLEIRRAFFLCTDRWQECPERFLDVFSFLQLPVEDAARQFVALRPRVNETVPRGDAPLSSLQEGESQFAGATELEPLRQAKEMLLASGAVHPAVSEWWRRICDLRLPQRMRRFGYDVRE